MISEMLVVNVVLVALNLVYIYILCGPTQSQTNLPQWTEKFAIDKDTLTRWNDTLRSLKNSGYRSDWWDFEGGGEGGGLYDDYAEELESEWGLGGEEEEIEDTTPIEPSTKFRCPPHPPDWVTIRSELNYKYMWIHGNDNLWMSATATMDTPLHHKAFEVIPVSDDCLGGWVRLRESDNNGFLRMVPPVNESEIMLPTVDNPFPPLLPPDIWTVHPDSDSIEVTRTDKSYHFLLEEDGYLLNRGSMAFVNVISPDYEVRGHGSSRYKKRPAKREYSSMMRFQFINDTVIEIDRNKQRHDEREAKDMDDELIEKIKQFSNAVNEKRVISFGLYGTNDKYTVGAIRNVELAKIYFPGWVCRFYVADDVPNEIITKLKELGAEISVIPTGKGYISGMFWRFLVASDETVDRYIIRDTDSRMNSRDAMAVQEWISSNYPIHIMRDHVNHCHSMNGGMWGGTKGSLNQIKDLIEKWENKDEYFADMSFLDSEIWPLVQDNQLSHDSYCCDKYPNARPFPSKRPPTYQHVGQVFDAKDNARLLDIDGYIRSIPVPHSCRLNNEWIYG